MMDASLQAVLSGAALGLTAGISPGPILALVVLESLAHGWRAGAKVALAPLLTDLPIIAAVWLALRHVAGQAAPLAALSVAGGLYLVSLGWDCLRGPDMAAGPAIPGTLRKAIVANFLNPHPYLFWLLVGVPMLARLATDGPAPAVLYLVSFYASIVGAKMAVAWLVARCGPVLGSRGHRALMAGLGLSLWVFAGLLVREGARLAGLL